MEPFNIQIDSEGSEKTLTIVNANDLFEIIYQGKVIGALRPPGADWQLLPMEELLVELPLYEMDLRAPIKDNFELHSPVVNQIAGAIENHLKQLPNI